MEKLKEILRKLNYTPKNYDINNLKNKDVYKIILEHSGYRENGKGLHNFYKPLVAKFISFQLQNKNFDGENEIDEKKICELLENKDDELYFEIFCYYFKEIKYLESYKNGDKKYLKGENFNIEYHLFLEILSTAILSDLNYILEKVKRNLSENVKPEVWYDLFLDEEYTEIDKTRIDNLIHGVLM